MPDLLTGAAQQAISGGLGLILGGINDNRQLRQQQELQSLQIAGQKQMTDYNFQKQLELWQATGYGAQMKQLKEAGLNPALLYGKSGGGGQTASITPGNVTGGQAPQGGREAIDMMGMGLNLQMMRSQIALNEAQAKKANTEADVTGGVGVQKMKQEASNLAATYDNIKAELENIKKTGANLDEQNKQIIAATQQATAQAQSISIQNKINEATTTQQIDKIKAESIGAVLQNTLTKANTALTNAQTEVEKKRINEIVQHITEMQSNVANNTNWADQDNKRKIAEAIKQLSDYETDPTNKWLENAGGTIQQILQMGGKGTPVPITGFRR